MFYCKFYRVSNQYKLNVNIINWWLLQVKCVFHLASLKIMTTESIFQITGHQ